MLQHELRGCDVQQYMVQLMSRPCYKAGEVIANTSLELGCQCRTLGGRTREAHWKWSSASLYHRKLQNRYVHNSQSLLCSSKRFNYFYIIQPNCIWPITSCYSHLLHYLLAQPTVISVLESLWKIPMIKSNIWLYSWNKNQEIFYQKCHEIDLSSLKKGSMNVTFP